jgi:NADPH2:quinone reductase
VVDRVGDGVAGIEPGQMVAALPISGEYVEFVCLPQRELVSVAAGLDAGEAVCLILNRITAYQMLHRSVHVMPGQRVLIHGAAGGVARRYCSLDASPGSRCTEPVRSTGRRPFPAWAASLSTTKTPSS